MADQLIHSMVPQHRRKAIQGSFVACRFPVVIDNSLQKPIPSDSPSEIVNYAEAPLHSAIKIFVTVLASLIPITSILVLYFVSNALDRLAIAVAFTGLFAFCLAVTTRARRVEIFGATSA
jgi:hypothetical protein